MGTIPICMGEAESISHPRGAESAGETVYPNERVGYGHCVWSEVSRCKNNRKCKVHKKQ